MPTTDPRSAGPTPDQIQALHGIAAAVSAYLDRLGRAHRWEPFSDARRSGLRLRASTSDGEITWWLAPDDLGFWLAADHGDGLDAAPTRFALRTARILASARRAEQLLIAQASVVGRDL